MTRIAIAGLAAFVLSVVLTQVCKRLAIRLDVVAHPRNDRWNRRSVPLLGGVAVAATVFVLLPVVVKSSPQVFAFMAGALVLLSVGLVDDVRELRPRSKLTAQVLVAGGLVAAGLYLRLTPFPIANAVLTMFWVVAVTNAFNLLDNMDGLAAGIAAIAAAYRLGFYVLDGNMEAAALAAVFTGAVLGFLVHNFAPASIFLGDAGSLFIGFFLSALSLIGGYPYSRSLFSVLLLPVLLLLVPLFDTMFVTISRTLARRPVSVGGSDHTSHRLVALGLSVRSAVLSLYLVAAAAGAVGVFTYRAGLSYSIALVVLLTLSVGVLAMYLSRIRVYREDQAPDVDAKGLVRLVSTLTARRHLATLVVDIVLMAVAYYTAYLLRFEEAIRLYDRLIVESLPLVIACQVLGFALFKVHHGVWRYAGVRDVFAIGRGATAGTLIAVALLVFTERFKGYSRAVFVIDWVLLVGFVSASRLSMRLFADLLRPGSKGLRRVLIYGAGDGGVLTCRELTNNRALGRVPVGFIDDDPRKQHRRIDGVPVLGGCEELEAIIARERVDEVLMASAKISVAHHRMVEEVCERIGLALVHAYLRIE